MNHGATKLVETAQLNEQAQNYSVYLAHQSHHDGGKILLKANPIGQISSSIIAKNGKTIEVGKYLEANLAKGWVKAGQAYEK